jgi:hypothetical protein
MDMICLTDWLIKPLIFFVILTKNFARADFVGNKNKKMLFFF